MKKPAIFIDAFISNDENKKWLDYNLSNYIKNDWDIFIISNKIDSFDKFSQIKYFEYDSRNRILPDRQKYILNSQMHIWSTLYDSDGEKQFKGYDLLHGFTNWTILHNLKKICKVLKNFGYQYMIRCEYDVVFKNYNLMDNIFKSFDSINKNINCMILKSDMGCATNFFLINIDYLDSKLPNLESESDYIDFINKLYGQNLSPVFEHLFNDLIKNDCIYMDTDSTLKNIENLSACISSGDNGYRYKIFYKDLLVTPVNDNTKFFANNLSEKNSVCFKYTTQNTNKETITSIHFINPKNYVLLDCNNFVEITVPNTTTQIDCVRFDLSTPCTFTYS